MSLPRTPSPRGTDGSAFGKILIANRGEIACRIAATARRLGIRTVAVFSDADINATHTRAADEARYLGPAPARASYLCIERVLDAAIASGAEAIHPGYGFLAENPEFADACAAAGIVFVGPPAEAIRLMGDKGRALERMSRAGVPVLPGHRGADQSDAALGAAARDIGLPLIVKPSAGGGGKGMHVVHTFDALGDALAAARREAGGAFGDDRLILERYLASARHVEVQVFADRHGGAVHILDRDCSVQRRHQKVVEEAPAPGLEPGLRERMAQAALTATRAVDYVGAGTVEFLVEAGAGGSDFFFMEMNTRLQVEHPVSEMITGIDLVEWQLAVAAGGRLPLSQDDIVGSGHAIEVRLYAEDPARGNLPSTGVVSALEWPHGAGVRVDAGVSVGDRIGIEYDPMIAKLVAHAANRDAAVRVLRAALDRTVVRGVTTNRTALASILDHPEFRAGGVDTGLLDRHDPGRADPAVGMRPQLLAAVVLWQLTRPVGGGDEDRFTPWSSLPGFRLNAPARRWLRIGDSGDVLDLEVIERDGGGYRVTGLADVEMIGGERTGPDALWVRMNTQAFGARVHEQGAQLTVEALGSRLVVEALPNARPTRAATDAVGRLTSPMPGTVIAVHVTEGESVERGRALLVVEAMKMEHAIIAPIDGVVERIAFGPGERVDEGVELVTLRPAAETPPPAKPAGGG